jgi:hypothetical protein
MARLTDITATVVSLVDRAAVRDPSDPTQPQKLLLWKSESGRNDMSQQNGGVMALSSPNTTISTAARRRMQNALNALKPDPNDSDGSEAALKTKIQALLHVYDSVDSTVSKAYAEGAAEGFSKREVDSRLAGVVPEALAKLDAQSEAILAEAESVTTTIAKREAEPLKKAEEKAEEIRKADPSLSRSDAMRQAMRDPEIAALYQASREQLAA